MIPRRFAYRHHGFNLEFSRADGAEVERGCHCSIVQDRAEEYVVLKPGKSITDTFEMRCRHSEGVDDGYGRYELTFGRRRLYYLLDEGEHHVRCRINGAEGDAVKIYGRSGRVILVPWHVAFKYSPWVGEIETEKLSFWVLVSDSFKEWHGEIYDEAMERDEARRAD